MDSKAEDIRPRDDLTINPAAYKEARWLDMKLRLAFTLIVTRRMKLMMYSMAEDTAWRESRGWEMKLKMAQDIRPRDDLTINPAACKEARWSEMKLRLAFTLIVTRRMKLMMMDSMEEATAWREARGWEVNLTMDSTAEANRK